LVSWVFFTGIVSLICFGDFVWCDIEMDVFGLLGFLCWDFELDFIFRFWLLGLEVDCVCFWGFIWADFELD